MAAGMIKDLEEKIAALNAALNEHKNDTGKKFKGVQNELNTKASLKDLEDLEAKLMERLQDLLNNLANMFADKEHMRKKFNQIEKNVSQLQLSTQILTWSVIGLAQKSLRHAHDAKLIQKTRRR